MACLYYYTGLRHFIFPLFPLTIIGTAVAFYVGFKNNQAYDRLWESRKIWGNIVNNSRSWSTTVKHYVGNQYRENDAYNAEELAALKKQLIYRHIAWLYALRSQLLINTNWEHVNLFGYFGQFGRNLQKRFGVGLFEDKTTVDNLTHYLEKSEIEDLINFQNTATQIIDKQSESLEHLRSLNLLNDIRYVELQNILNKFYDYQGMAERIKKFPLPRQYANMSFIFVCLFILLLPFGIVSEFAKLGPEWIFASIPAVVIVSWIYVSMELVGDYSENPFEGLYNDIPMYALCRTIEIDLLEMLGEKDLPPSIQAINGVLM